MECAPYQLTPVLLLLLLLYSDFMILFLLEEAFNMRHVLLGGVLLHEQRLRIKLRLESALLHLRVYSLTRYSLELQDEVFLVYC